MATVSPYYMTAESLAVVRNHAAAIRRRLLILRTLRNTLSTSRALERFPDAAQRARDAFDEMRSFGFSDSAACELAAIHVTLIDGQTR